VQFDVPVRLLTSAQLRLGRRGFSTHARGTKAFGGTHTDPGEGFPLDKVMRMTRDYAAQIAA
jgi:hypothetical protein